MPDPRRILARIGDRLVALGSGTGVRTRALRHGLLFAGLFFAAYTFLVVAPAKGTFGFDAFAYYSVDLADPYRLPVGSLGAFTYPPPAAIAAQPFGLVPFPTFLFGWTALLVGTLIFLGGRWTLYLLAFPPVALELYHGNIALLLAAAVVLGFRYPAAHAFLLLTKSSCGVGLLWFAVRREWRALAIALSTAGAIAGVSLLVAPGLWVDYAGFLATSLQEPPRSSNLAIPLVIRLPLAAAIVIWGARTDRIAAVPIAITLAQPVLWWASFALLAALVRLPRIGEGGVPPIAVTAPEGPFPRLRRA